MICSINISKPSNDIQCKIHSIYSKNCFQWVLFLTSKFLPKEFCENFQLTKAALQFSIFIYLQESFGGSAEPERTLNCNNFICSVKGSFSYRIVHYTLYNSGPFFLPLVLLLVKSLIRTSIPDTLARGAETI